jgi:molybdopterin adenylyltransferase
MTGIERLDFMKEKVTGCLEALCVSRKKGVQKTRVEEAILLAGYGMEGDAHAGNWHRQISLLSAGDIEAFRAQGIAADYGAFGENMVVSGVPFEQLEVGDRIYVGDARLTVTQIGKACHKSCVIREQTGDCIMPRAGVFCVVDTGAVIRTGESVEVLPPADDRPFTAAVITLSDRAAAGVYEDQSGPEVSRILTEHGYEVLESLLLPDEREQLEAELRRLSDQRQVSVIFTTGGTGFSTRDVTPEATEAVSDRKVPGIGEALRRYSAQFTAHAMLSRQTAGIRKKTLIVNLPGSPKACREELDFLLKPLAHGLGVLRGSEDQ